MLQRNHTQGEMTERTWVPRKSRDYSFLTGFWISSSPIFAISTNKLCTSHLNSVLYLAYQVLVSPAYSSIHRSFPNTSSFFTDNESIEPPPAYLPSIVEHTLPVPHSSP